MLKGSKKTRRDTRSLKVIRIGNKFRIRLPSFLSPPLFVLLGTILAVVLLFPYTETVQSFDLPKLGEAAKETIKIVVVSDPSKPGSQTPGAAPDGYDITKEDDAHIC